MHSPPEKEKAAFEAAWERLPSGYSEGVFDGYRYGVTVKRSDDGRRNSLFARDLAAFQAVQVEAYDIGGGETLLKPCEMSSEKVVRFVLGFTLAE